MTASMQSVIEGFTEKSLKVGGRTIKYLEGGVGDALVVIHGGSGWLSNMTPVHTSLAEQFRVIAPELPGFGSSPEDGIDSVRDLAKVIIDMMKALEVERYSVLGTSIGGAVGLWAAIDAPDTVDKLVLEAPAAFRKGTPPPGPPPGAGPPGDRPAPDPALFAYMQRILGPDTDPLLVEAMPGCEVPTLVLFGQVDRMFPPRFAVDYARLARVNLAIVYAAGHDIKGERPEAYLDTVRDFLHRGSGFVVNQNSTLIHA